LDSSGSVNASAMLESRLQQVGINAALTRMGGQGGGGAGSSGDGVADKLMWLIIDDDAGNRKQPAFD